MNEMQRLIALSHDLGAESRKLAILGEGNTSVRLSDDSFLVKSTQGTLENLAESDVVECRFSPLLELLDREEMGNTELEAAVAAARVDASSALPSVETLFHAYLLSLPGVNFVGHTHAVAVNQVLCSPRGRDYAAWRMFPDEVVCCGPASGYVSYTDPGLRLPQAIREEVERFMEEWGMVPRVILLENHGIITLGAAPETVMSAMLMAQKSAEIFIGAATLGGPRFLSDRDVDRVAARIAEGHRHRTLVT